MPWSECVNCGTGFWREAGESWKIRCLECWRDMKNREEQADYEDLARQVRELQGFIQFILQGISDHWSFLIIRSHPDMNNGSREAEACTRWLLDARSLSKNQPRFLE
jgi:hypothetical protein